MSMEQALLAYARPHMLAEKARGLVRAEASKGCRPEIAPEPVSLEPPYQPILANGDAANTNPPALWTAEPSIGGSDIVRLQVWISPDQPWDWKRSERFLKHLGSATHRIGLEIVGNQLSVQLRILCHRRDTAGLCSAFRAEFERCERCAGVSAP